MIRRLLRAAAAGGRADRLVAEARAEAEAEVRDLVKSAVKAALLREAVARLELDAGAPPPAPEPEAPAAPEAEPPPAGSEPERGCYLFGVVAADHPGLPDAAADADPAFAVRLVRRGKLQALVSPVALAEFRPPEGRGLDLDWVAAKARAHDDILARALEGGPVVPFRFCTITRTEDDARQVLARHHDALVELLAALRDKREWGVKLVRRPPGEAADKGPDPSGGGAAYLRGRQRERASRREAGRREQAAARRCHERLRELACDAALLPPQSADADRPAVFNGTYLVADADADHFHALARELAAECGPDGLDLTVTGPWPAYNFARIDLSAEAVP
jgi:hypothetical protein